MKLLRAAAFYLLVVLTVSRTSALDFQLSAEWAKAIPVFQANVDKVGEHRYTNYREPVVVKTNSGKLIVGVHAGNRLSWPERSGQDLAIRISSDNGKSWSPITIAAEHGNYSCQCHGLVYDSEKNRILFLYTVYNWDYREAGEGRGKEVTAPIYKNLTEKNIPLVNSFEVHSDDEGLTWSQSRDITPNVGRQAHFGASEGRQLTVEGAYKGRLLLAGGRIDLNEVGYITTKYPGVWHSDDHGESWTFAEISVDPQVKSADIASVEARVTELTDGTLLYNQRTRKGRFLATSRDGGTTWTNTAHAPELLATQCNGSLLTLRDAQGKLTNTVLHSIPSPGGRSNGVIYVSKDGGKNWPIAQNVVEGHFAYSALIQVDAHAVGLIFETEHYEDIRFITLPIALLTYDY
jgi:sialidase-1